MKLVEINDVRVGQVLERDRCFFVIEDRTGVHNFATTLYCHNHKSAPNNAYEALSIRERNIAAFDDCEIIGKIGITHRIEDNRLVEIPPVFKEQKINTDDIVKILEDDSCPWVVVTTYNAKKYKRYISLLSYHDSHFSENEVEKIGVLGVTHEFVNDREVQQ